MDRRHYLKTTGFKTGKGFLVLINQAALRLAKLSPSDLFSQSRHDSMSV